MKGEPKEGGVPMAATIRWVGHSTFELASEGRTVVIDPWYTDSPVAVTERPDDVDVVFLTHDHWDHVKDAGLLARAGARVVTQPETAARLVAEEGVPDASILRMNVGGSRDLGGGLKATMIQAFHTSRTGVAAGYVIELGPLTVAHLGDTALFQDLRLYGGMFQIDVAMVPMGDVFTMGPEAAAQAAAFLGARVAVPMHYRTFPALLPTPGGFVEAVGRVAPGVCVWAPAPGEARDF